MSVVFIPGLGRSATDLAGWLERLPGSRVLDYPRLENPTLDAYVAHFAEVIPAGSFVVGESLGGLVALGLAGLGYPGLGVDFPLTTAKQWTLHRSLHSRAERFPLPEVFAFNANLFGHMSDGAIVERNHYPLLLRVTAPFAIVTGSIPLNPPGADPYRPCMIDEDDAVFIRETKVDLFKIAGGHLLLSENPVAILALIREREGLSASNRS